jgi:hypothetical protein
VDCGSEALSIWLILSLTSVCEWSGDAKSMTVGDVGDGDGGFRTFALFWILMTSSMMLSLVEIYFFNSVICTWSLLCLCTKFWYCLLASLT